LVAPGFLSGAFVISLLKNFFVIIYEKGILPIKNEIKANTIIIVDNLLIELFIEILTHLIK